MKPTVSKKPFDFWIFMTVLILLAIGTVMVFSASGPSAYNEYGDTYFFLRKQLIAVVFGFISMFITMNIDYKKLGKLSPILLAVSIALLALVLVPGIGVRKNGAQRWLQIPGQSWSQVQPSEFAKLALILFFAYSLSKRKDQLESFFRGLLPYLMLTGIFAVLLLLEPHKSCTIIIGLVAGIILFSAGAKIRHFMVMIVPVLTGMTAVILFSPYARSRVTSFLDPFADPVGTGWQTINSLYAIGSGGIFGRGLGKSLQKFLYIPEPQNDYIFAILAEELGFIGVVAILLLFLIFVWRGIKIAMNAPDKFGSITALGITALISVQALLNILVVTGSIPATGVTLPFISYGGTSLMFLMAGVGILLNISKYSNYDRI
ncbi:MAG TPA: putative lipid II flippase FtsW [Clostridia bacterium]|nr:putative lipid II flippase FtsW [Clostridia bacterium]